MKKCNEPKREHTQKRNPWEEEKEKAREKSLDVRRAFLFSSLRLPSPLEHTVEGGEKEERMHIFAEPLCHRFTCFGLLYFLIVSLPPSLPLPLSLHHQTLTPPFLLPPLRPPPPAPHPPPPSSHESTPQLSLIELNCGRISSLAHPSFPPAMAAATALAASLVAFQFWTTPFFS